MANRYNLKRLPHRVKNQYKVLDRSKRGRIKQPKYFLGAVTGLLSAGLGIANMFIQNKRQREADTLAAKNEKEFLAEQTQQQRESFYSNSPTATNEYRAAFKRGGVAGMQQPQGDYEPNAELEQKEVYRTPDKKIHSVGNNARTHGEGGEFYNLPVGTEILGNIKFKCCGGKMAKQLGLTLSTRQKHLLDILSSRPTSIDRITAEKMLAKVDRSFTTILEKQELRKRGLQNLTPKPYLIQPTGGKKNG
jgi:hypothetical protein